jgi:hypothetical protein
VVRTLTIMALAAAASLVLLSAPRTAVGETPVPSPLPSSSPDPEPTVTPAGADLVRWALAWRRAAVREWNKWNRARSCLGLPRRYFDGRRPERSAPAEVWREAGREWKHRVRPGGARTYQERTRALVRRMKRPGGSGAARWWPLARWVGWPAAQRANLVRCITLESGGRPDASNGYCFGLMQLHRCHAVASPFDPEANLRGGLRLWRASGWVPWTTMRGY